MGNTLPRPAAAAATADSPTARNAAATAAASPAGRDAPPAAASVLVLASVDAGREEEGTGEEAGVMVIKVRRPA